MREIKFRAWDKIENKILDWDILKNQSYNVISSVENPASNWTLMQFTGLQDKNGKEIYEGDIVKDSDDSVRIIKWENGSFFGRLTIVPHLALMTDKEMYNCEIIGNIYENKELLNN